MTCDTHCSLWFPFNIVLIACWHPIISDRDVNRWICLCAYSCMFASARAVFVSFLKRNWMNNKWRLDSTFFCSSTWDLGPTAAHIVTQEESVIALHACMCVCLCQCVCLCVEQLICEWQCGVIRTPCRPLCSAWWVTEDPRFSVTPSDTWGTLSGFCFPRLLP